MKQGNIAMAEKAFEKVEELNSENEPDLSQSLLGTDLFILKGDKETAKNICLSLIKKGILIKASPSKSSPTYIKISRYFLF